MIYTYVKKEYNVGDIFKSASDTKYKVLKNLGKYHLEFGGWFTKLQLEYIWE